MSGASDVRKWHPHALFDPLRQTLNHSIETTVALPPASVLPAGEYLVGVGLPDPRMGYECLGCAVRFANLADAAGAGPYWFGGVNVVGQVTL